MKAALLVIRPLPAPPPPPLCWFGELVSLRHFWTEEERLEKSFWSALNSLEGKAKRGEEKSYLHSLCRQNVVSGTFSLESTDQILPFFLVSFFKFPMTVFVVHELYLWDSAAAPGHHCSPPAGSV